MIKTLLKQRPDNSALTKRILLTLKLTGMIIMIMCMQVSAGSFAQQKINISANQTSIKNLLKMIEKQTEYRFVYSNNTLANDRKITVNIREASLDEAMKTVLKETGLIYMLKESNLVVIYASKNVQQDIVVSGRVTDQNGLPLPGVSVKVSGVSLATTTDANGAYSIRVPDNSTSLEFTYVGYVKKVIPLNGGVLNVTLQVDNQNLQEVVVTGYTAYKKSQSASSSTLVTGDKINDVPGLTFDQILQGRVPGMSVISSSGQPGTSATTVIRGIGSVNGSSTPLYILDGTPIEGGFFQTINPEDIEDVRVLKDASAKALYGSRGSNGVIIITSKKGKAGKVQVQYSSQYGFSDLTRSKTTMMNTAQRLAFEEGVGVDFGRTLGPGWTYSSKNPDYINGTAAFRQQADQIMDSLRNINIDWRDQIYQNSKFQEQQASVSGGNENIRFYNSLNYYKQDGIAKRTGLERYSLKSNVDFKDNKFSGNVNIAIGYSNSSFTEGEGSTGSGTAMSAAYYALPYENPYAPDGTLIHPGNQDNYFILDQREGSQALERLQNSSNKTDQLKSIIGISLAYQILPELKVTTRMGVDYRNSTDQLYINPDSYYGSTDDTYTLGGKGRYEEGTRRNFNFISTTGLTYAKTFNEKHDFEASAYYEYVYNNYNAFNFAGFGLDGRLPETPAGITNSADFLPEVGGGKTKSGLASFMGVARYTYDEKYTLTGSYRYDGSTKVAPKNKWHGFYSGGANWNVKKESFLQDFSLISDFNLRTSYGTTASPLSGDFNYLATYDLGATYNGQTGLRPTSPGNVDYDWEYVNEFNAGFDLTLFKSRRLRLTMDFYNKKTSNMFFDQPLSALSGFESVSLSTGKMQNRGIEFDISGDLVKTASFTWSLGANAGYNKNKILFLTDAADQLLDGDTRIFQVGLPYGSYYAPGWAGVNSQTGDAQYYNPDGSITNVYNATTQSVANSGSMFPKLTGGFNTSLSYKGFSATALFSFVSGIKRWNNEDFYNENQRYATSNQSLRMLEDRWMKPGDEKTLQRFNVPRNFTSKDIEDASFLRLRNLNIGYAVPQKTLDKIGVIKTLKFFIQGQNLFTWTKWRGMDPENNSVYGRFQYPNARTYTAGLSANF
ncbi:SusC/RagA family TonB-linked outer membrane protein [Pedobacter sp. MR2016-24]|uniref:SusC/RagA family TonB-linked outer membrane protein n=1 Tax=Pedobacter sp. MR2016-24 TaxID=2994466 RepID=UPI002246FC8F|nr:SusC/RagA family TonB-linked outer membrane protein [Pedobacter sp. MR2016-24]MCX2484727.1 SusC/RagA family TonB-linked outer membrane protein [Pedobacter sp. MR2016-24]